jgi:hypothetical protein
LPASWSSWSVRPFRCATAIETTKPGVQKPHCAAVMVDHRLLHRVQRAVGAGDAFDRAHRLAVQLRQEQDAGVQRRAPARR